MKFHTCVMDAPWRYKSPGWLGGADRHYPTLPVEAIAKMPIKELVDNDAHLWMWTTDTFLEEAMWLMRMWDFEKKATWEWIKLSKKPISKKQKRDFTLKHQTIVTYQGEEYGLSFGNGYYGRSCSEFLLLGVRGNNITNHEARQQRKVFHAPVGEHSEKPDFSYRLIEKYSPGPKIELFSRKKRMGWTNWGNEVHNTNSPFPALDNWSDWATKNYPEKRR